MLDQKQTKKASVAGYIHLKAKPGQEENLEELLKKGAEIVRDTEPDTVYWVALKLGDGSYGIFDTFTDDQGRESHFNGQVANALRAQAGRLVEGGWENGVLKQVQNFKILATSIY